jgi:hypothetical protein
MDTELVFLGYDYAFLLSSLEKRSNCYCLESGTFTKTKGLRIYQDLALILGVHPSALGVHANGNGQILVPRQSF